VGECGGPDCMFSLATNLAVIFGTQIVVGNIVKYIIPYFYKRKRSNDFLAKINGGECSDCEMEYLLNVYEPIGTSIRNYTTVAIQFGYMYVQFIYSSTFL